MRTGMSEKLSEVVQIWQRKAERVNKLKADLEVAKREMKDAGVDVVKMMAPTDARVGEKFCLYCRPFRHDPEREVLFGGEGD